jgi:hypothetical protein
MVLLLIGIFYRLSPHLDVSRTNGHIFEHFAVAQSHLSLMLIWKNLFSPMATFISFVYGSPASPEGD